MDGTDGAGAAAAKGCDAVDRMVRRVQCALEGPPGLGPTDLQWALHEALSEAGAACGVVGRGWSGGPDGGPLSVAVEAGVGTYDHRGRVMRHYLEFEVGADGAPVDPAALRPGRHGRMLLEAFRADMAREAPEGGWAHFGREPPDDLRDRLAAMLAEVVDAELHAVRLPGTDRAIGLTLGSYRQDLAERACALLEEAGA